jgi:hypothetical protein
MQRATGVEPVRHPIAIDGDGRLTAISGTSWEAKSSVRPSRSVGRSSVLDRINHHESLYLAMQPSHKYLSAFVLALQAMVRFIREVFIDRRRRSCGCCCRSGGSQTFSAYRDALAEFKKDCLFWLLSINSDSILRSIQSLTLWTGPSREEAGNR